MKTSHIVIILIVALLGIFAFKWAGKKSEVVNVPPTMEGCYVATLGKDVYTLNVLSEENGVFDGTLRFKNFEKDSSSGTYEGTYTDGILLGDYSFASEGTDSVMQVIFKKVGDDFVRGFGPVTAEGTRFADLNDITYDTNVVFQASTCENPV